MADHASGTTEVRLERFDGELDFLPKDGDGNTVSLELACIGDFYNAHPKGIPSKPRSDDPRAPLPQLNPLEKSKRRFTDKIKIDASGLSTHYQAHVRFTVGPTAGSSY